MESRLPQYRVINVIPPNIAPSLPLGCPPPPSSALEVLLSAASQKALTTGTVLSEVIELLDNTDVSYL